MSAVPLVGPHDGRAMRLARAEPGRLAVDDLAADGGLSSGRGWVEPAGVSGETALVRLSTAGLGSDEAVAELLASVLSQARAAGATRVVLETDDDARSQSSSGAVEGLDVVLVPPLRVTNSLGRRVERFVTREPGRVGMYSCGPTVYSYAHLGNMRAYVFADTLKRTLRWRGLDVHHVINITDVGHLLADADQGEDKVEEASRREGRSVEEITQHYTQACWDDLRALHVTPPDEWPRASAHIAQMINFAVVLQDHGYGYVLPEGLYFDTGRQPGYGELAGIDRAAQRESGRVEGVEGKRSRSDFALWRTFTDGRPRLMQWASPWGTGAPGWHLECSVMSMALLGDHFDLHTGGVDHRELHHVNEIAQSEAYLEDGRPWVRYWVHNEFLAFKGSKMAKSAGAILGLRDLVAIGVHPLAFRYLLLGSHYGSQLDFTESSAQSAHVALKRLALRLVAVLRPAAPAGAPGPAASDAPADGRAPAPAGDGPAPGARLDQPITLAEALDEAAVLGSAVLRQRLLALDAAIAGDLMSPAVLALINTWAKDPDALPPAEWDVLVRAVNTLTGLLLGILGTADFAPALPESVDLAWVEDRLAERDAARGAKDWTTADRMRDELTGAGIRVEDTPEGTHWFKADGPVGA